MGPVGKILRPRTTTTMNRKMRFGKGEMSINEIFAYASVENAQLCVHIVNGNNYYHHHQHHHQSSPHVIKNDCNIIILSHRNGRNQLKQQDPKAIAQLDKALGLNFYRLTIIKIIWTVGLDDIAQLNRSK